MDRTGVSASTCLTKAGHRVSTVRSGTLIIVPSLRAQARTFVELRLAASIDRATSSLAANVSARRPGLGDGRPLTARHGLDRQVHQSGQRTGLVRAAGDVVTQLPELDRQFRRGLRLHNQPSRTQNV